MTIKITPNERATRPASWPKPNCISPTAARGSEADRILGLGAPRRQRAQRHVPGALSTVVNGERRSFALLRPIVDATAQNKLRELILEAFQEYEERAAIAS